MSKTYLISDTHFGHTKVLQFESQHRPFATIAEHDECLVDNWNQVVKDEDTVYHLGDVAWNKTVLSNTIPRLKGKKILVGGNHDKMDTQLYLDSGFTAMFGACSLGAYLLTHVPIHKDEMRWQGGNIHGHRHSQLPLEGKYFCVSCEQVNLAPIDFELVKSMLSANGILGLVPGILIEIKQQARTSTGIVDRWTRCIYQGEEQGRTKVQFFNGQFLILHPEIEWRRP